MELRRVEQDSVRNLDLVQDLAERIWREHYTPIIGSEQVEYMLGRFQSAPAIAEQIGNGFVYYLLLHQGAAAGYLAYVPGLWEAGLQLSKLYVLRDYRGKGLGKAGLEHVQKDCQQLGLDLIWLTVNKHNQASISWYKRMGFAYARSLVTDIGGGFVMDDYMLQKRVDSREH